MDIPLILYIFLWKKGYTLKKDPFWNPINKSNKVPKRQTPYISEMQFIYDWEIPDPIFKEAVNKRLDFTNFLLFDELVINIYIKKIKTK